MLNFSKFHENVKSKMFKACSNIMKSARVECLEYLSPYCSVYLDGACIGSFTGVCTYLVYLVQVKQPLYMRLCELFIGPLSRKNCQASST